MKSNAPWLPDLYVFGIYVVNIAALAEKEAGRSHDAVIVQDFLVIPRTAGERVELYKRCSSGRSSTYLCSRMNVTI